MVMDNPTDPYWLTGGSTAVATARRRHAVDLKDSLPRSTSRRPTELAQAKGWYLSSTLHEQVVTSAITVFGNTTFSTHTPVVPVAGSCDSNLGTARVYNVRYFNAAPKPGN